MVEILKMWHDVTGVTGVTDNPLRQTYNFQLMKSSWYRGFFELGFTDKKNNEL